MISSSAGLFLPDLFVSSVVALSSFTPLEKYNLNGKIPTIVDPNLKGPDGKPLNVFESGAILVHLAENYPNGKNLLSTDPAQRSLTLQWLFWQMAGVGPMFGQFFHFHKYAPEQIEYAKTRYKNEVNRLLKVLEAQLGLTGAYISGPEYSIADIATWPWINGFINWVKDIVPINEATHPNITKWHAKIAARPAVIKGLTVLPM